MDDKEGEQYDTDFDMLQNHDTPSAEKIDNESLAGFKVSTEEFRSYLGFSNHAETLDKETLPKV